MPLTPIAHSPQGEVVNLLDDLDEHELQAMVNERQLFVAEARGTVVGCAGWRGENLRHVYVTPESERAGIGADSSLTPSPGLSRSLPPV